MTKQTCCWMWVASFCSRIPNIVLCTFSQLHTTLQNLDQRKNNVLQSWCKVANFPSLCTFSCQNCNFKLFSFNSLDISSYLKSTLVVRRTIEDRWFLLDDYVTRTWLIVFRKLNHWTTNNSLRNWIRNPFLTVLSHCVFVSTQPKLITQLRESDQKTSFIIFLRW